MLKINFTIFVENQSGDTIETYTPQSSFELEQLLFALNNYYEVAEEDQMSMVTLKVKDARKDTTIENEMKAFEALYATGILPLFENLEDGVVHEEALAEPIEEYPEPIEEYPTIIDEYGDE